MAERLRRRDGLLSGWPFFVFACAASGLMVFGAALGHHFSGDDVNEIGKAAAGPVGGEWFAGGHGTVFLRPLFYATLWVDHAFHGKSPLGYHLANIGLHVANSVLVALLAKGLEGRSARRSRVGQSGPTAFQIIAGLSFLVLPSHGEAVYWISARADLLATFFALVAMITLVRSIDEVGRTSRVLSTVSATAFALALLSKESAATLPIAAFLLALLVLSRNDDRVPGVERTRLAVKAASPHVLVLLGYFLLRWRALGTPIGGYGLSSQASAGLHRPVGQFFVSVARSFLPSGPRLLWILLAAALVGGAVGLIAIPAGRRRLRGALVVPVARRAALLGGVLAVLVVPVVGVGVSPFGPSGERTVYLPSVVASLAIAAVLVSIAKNRVRFTAALTSLALIAGLLAVREAHRWSDADAASTAVLRSMASRELGGVAYLVNLPDEVRGAVAARNSTAWLDVFTRDAQAGRILVVSAISLASPRDSFWVSRSLTTSSGWTLTVRARQSPLEISEFVDDGPWRVGDTTPLGYSVWFPSDVDPERVWVYSDGAVTRLTEVE